MEVDQYVTQVQSQLVNAASLGDDATRSVAGVLASAAEPAVRLAILSAVSAAADEVTAALLDSPGAPVVGVRLDGDELRVEVRLIERADAVEDPAPGGIDEAENTARISLRLPETLKTQIDAAARSSGASVNTWILRAATVALSGSAWRGHRPPVWDAAGGGRLSGWLNG